MINMNVFVNIRFALKCTIVCVNTHVHRRCFYYCNLLTVMIKRVIGYLNGGGQSQIAFVNTESRSAETKRITTKQISIEARCRKPPLLKLGQF